MPGELRFIDELNTVLTEIEAASDRVIEAHDFGARRYGVDDACEYVDGTHGGDVADFRGNGLTK